MTEHALYDIVCVTQTPHGECGAALEEARAPVEIVNWQHQHAHCTGHTRYLHMASQYETIPEPRTTTPQPGPAPQSLSTETTRRVPRLRVVR